MRTPAIALAASLVLQFALALGVVIGLVDFLLQKILIDLVGKLAG